ncbi:MAG: hypothetical protein J6U54_01565 [Clostridiales bacterium]|nr:hypothetical protein [Clostridiales bacterium]
MKIQATLREINDSFPYFKQIVNEKLPYDVGYQVYMLSEKLDKVLGYLRDRATKEIAGLSNEDANRKIQEILETKIELDMEQIDRERFFKGLPADILLPPIAYSMISFALTAEEETESQFKVI